MVRMVAIMCLSVSSDGLMILKEPFTTRKLIAVVLSLTGCVLVVKAYASETWQLNPTVCGLDSCR